MNTPELILTVLAVTIGTMITRFTPFVLFPEGKKRPQVIDYLSLKLPAAMMGLLVIYCLKGIDFSSALFGAAELIGVGVTAGLHVWKRNVLLSIAVGTAVYMLLIRFVF